MSDVIWIKLYIDLFENVKIKNLDALPKADTYFRIWINLLILAGKTNNKGFIYFSEDRPYTNQSLAIVMNRSKKVVAEAISLFEEFKMIEIENGFIKIINWSKYQSLDKLDAIRENNRNAKRRQRSKQAANVTDNVTDMSSKSRTCHDTELELDLEVEKDKEKDKEKIRQNKEKDKEKTKKFTVHSRAKEERDDVHEPLSESSGRTTLH